MIKTILVLISIFGQLSLLAKNTEPQGSRNNPLNLAINPAVQASKSLDNVKPFIKCLEEEANLFVKLTIPNNYIAIVEGMNSQIDVAFTDIMGYLLASQKYGAEPLLKVSHYGKTYYRSMIIVRKESPIQRIEDLNGRSFAFSDASSASSFILPHIAMKEKNVKPSAQLATGSMDAAMMAVMQKKVDAAAGFYDDSSSNVTFRDARRKLLTSFPRIYDETRIAWLSEPIPNEPVIVRKDLHPKTKEILKAKLPICIRKNKNLINNIDNLFEIKPNDHVYENFRKMVVKSKLDIGKILSDKQ